MREAQSGGATGPFVAQVLELNTLYKRRYRLARGERRAISRTYQAPLLMQVLFFGLSQTLTPDVVLMDPQMPGMDGIAATAALRRVVPKTRRREPEHL